ncbi:hypothetical protein Q5H80_16160 [Vibrio sp. SNU_ST1]|uniref:hypothetical protein n=1 Tax=Vibrio sp. SNU_ST1 TaxID=3064001 RepID=UPI00272A508D|nr:hypothetical protein [Vibrio sp. SNU_ST1]WKY60374.1 hypothetical protein Q5H80_16160 [Vibrio sp. SNU_ST1]
MSKEEFEIRIECGGTISQYGKVVVEDVNQIEDTLLYKKVSEVAKSCAHDGKCKISTISVNDSDYYKDIKTPCGSSISNKARKKKEQKLAKLTFNGSLLFSGIFLLFTLYVMSISFDDSITLIIVLVAYLSFSFNIIGDYPGAIMANLKKILALVALLLTLYKLGFLQYIVG